MPIEFACTGCRKRLRVADSAAGKKARCPDCGEISDVPLSGDSPFAGASPFASPSGAEGVWTTSNWSDATPTSSREATSDNPFSSPTSDYDRLRSLSMEEIRGRVAGPAICLMVTAGITATVYFVSLCFFAVAALFGQVWVGGGLEDIVGTILGLGTMGIPLGRAILIFYGAWQMKQLRNYPLAMTAAILAVVPFCSCIIDLPFGIWALALLANAQVKAGFQSARK